jgi:hypothetical protein
MEEVWRQADIIDHQVKNATRLAADGTSACALIERPFRPLLNGCCVTFLKINSP